MSSPADIPFQQLIDALLDADTPLKPRFLYRLSDLDEPELSQLKAAWPGLPLWRRQALMEDIEDLSERDTLLSFISMGLLAAQDESPVVRLIAVRTLRDYNDAGLIPVLLNLLDRDSDIDVRRAAVDGLGQYVYAGEVDLIPRATLKRIEDALLSVARGDDAPQLRRSALESMGYSSRPEVTQLIEAAYTSNDKDWLASALFAMGRSANPDWNDKVLAMLESSFPQARSEAARAAGELEISEAVPSLLELLDDPDENTRLASIWSLSQIGGEGVSETLQQLYQQAEDEQEIRLLEDALENLVFTEGAQFMPLFNFPDDEQDDLLLDDEQDDLLL
ncbi:MAG: HEAT repeat domain-containing protein, partial [Anaerolineales bacterium]|nr:HEAT repeat domain-containing protein [Anaerolineales bacterium]